MNKMLHLSLLLIIIGLFSIFKSTAGSSIGGHISWNCVGQDSFIITATYYRDCNHTPLLNPIVVVTCSTTGDTLSILNLPTPSNTDVTPTCPSSCNRCQPPYNCSFPYGFSKYESSKLLLLSSAGSCCKVDLNFDGGPRPTGTTSGYPYQNFFIKSTLNRCIGLNNNSPSFAKDPVFISCVGTDQYFGIEAIDGDEDSLGNLLDSLSFELTSPLVNPNSNFIFTGQYSFNKPIRFWGFPNSNLPFPRGFHIDKQSGSITCKPMNTDKTVMAVKIMQWRNINGVMTIIGEQIRDYSVYIISCTGNTNPVIIGSKFDEVCAGDTLEFSFTTSDINSTDTVCLYYDNSSSNAIWTANNNNVKHASAVLRIPTSASNVSRTGEFIIYAKDNRCPINGLTVKIVEYKINTSIASNTWVHKTDKACGLHALKVLPYDANNQYNWYSSIAPFTINGSSQHINTYIYDTGSYPYHIEINGKCDSLTYYDTLMITDSSLSLIMHDTIYFSQKDSILVSPQIKNIKGALKFVWSDHDSINLNKWFYYKNDTISEVFYLNIWDSTSCFHQHQFLVLYDSFLVDCGEDIYKCTNDIVTLTANYQVLNNLSNVKYSTWYGKGIPTPLAFGNSYATIKPGIYICVVELFNGMKEQDTVQLFDYTIINANAGIDTILCSDHGLYELLGSPNTDSVYWFGTGVSKTAGKYYFDPRDPAIKNGISNKIEYQIVDQNGCTSSDYRYITVYYSSLKPTIEDVPELCENSGAYRMKADISPGYWSGPAVSGELFNTNISGNGVYQILYWVGNPYCKSYDTTYITVKPKPNIKLKTEYGINNFCKEYGLIEIRPEPGGGKLTGPLYQDYYFNTDTSFGSYSFLYSITDTSYCQADSQTIVLNVGQTEVEIVNNDSFCLYQWIQLTAHDSFTSGIEWIVAAGSNGKFYPDKYQQNVSYNPDSNDLSRRWFNIKIKTTDTICATVWDSMLIRIIDLPEADFDRDPAYYDSTLNQYFVQFYNRSIIPDGYVESYLWRFGDGKISPEQNPLHAYNRKDKFRVSLTVITNYACYDSTGKFDFVDLFLSNQEIAKGKIELFPNPSSNSITITSDIQIQELALYNSLSELIEQVDIKDFQYLIKRQVRGIYYLRVIDINKQVYMEKIIFR